MSVSRPSGGRDNAPLEQTVPAASVGSAASQTAPGGGDAHTPPERHTPPACRLAVGFRLPWTPTAPTARRP